jgi:short-subunit dehydrogenase
MAGLLGGPWLAPYSASKFAVVGISQSLYYELASTRVGVSVLCPGWVNTNIATSYRNRPVHLGGSLPENEGGPMAEVVAQLLAGGMAPSEVADHVADAVRRRRFWILTHSEMLPVIEGQTSALAAGENPPPFSFPT